MAFPAITHRPYPPPTAPWVMFQVWHDLLFAHWPVPVSTLRPLVPEALPLDSFDGTAWLAVVPFHMTDVRARFTPSMPRVSAFPELNVRTYVTLDGRPGLYFFSLDAGDPLAVAAARALYCLPYYTAEMRTEERDGWVHYRSRRVHRRAAPAELEMRYRPVGDARPGTPGSLEYFLTERYCFYTLDRRGRVRRCEAHHAPWPLQPAEAEFERNRMTAPLGVALPDTPPLLHYSRRMDAFIWPLLNMTGR